MKNMSTKNTFVMSGTISSVVHLCFLILIFFNLANCDVAVTTGLSDDSYLQSKIFYSTVVSDSPFSMSTHDLRLRVGQVGSTVIKITESFNKTFENETTVELVFVPSSPNIISDIPSITFYNKTDNQFLHEVIVPVVAERTGRVTVKTYVDASAKRNLSSTNIFLRVSVYQYAFLIVLSDVVGWIYFAAWSVSFYPQIYQNWRRKSVRGLSLDFVFLNWTGFVVYSMFNIGLFAVPSVQQEYLNRNPTGQIPVQLNDVFFSVHAVFATSVTCMQCICYDKGSQTVSKTGKTILMSIFAVVFVLLVVTLSRAILWLDFLTACSTIKLLITLIKYVPQAYMNYARKSTSGWCIGNILLDLTGGILSVIQMLILAFNNSDWKSLFGDYTKFGLGAFSILFDMFFIIQHYILYKNHEEYEPIEGTTIPTIEDPEDMVTSANHLQTTESEGGISSSVEENER